VNSGYDLRSALAGIHDLEEMPNLLIVADDLSSILADKCFEHLAMTLAHLEEAQGFFDRSLRENAFKLEMGVEGSGGQGEGRDRTPFVGCELIISEGISETGRPNNLYVYDRFFPNYITIVEHDGVKEMSQPSVAPRCHRCGCPWLARFSARDGVTSNPKFCCSNGASVLEDNASQSLLELR